MSVQILFHFAFLIIRRQTDIIVTDASNSKGFNVIIRSNGLYINVKKQRESRTRLMAQSPNKMLRFILLNIRARTSIAFI